MTRFVSGIIFYILYLFMYLAPLFVVLIAVFFIIGLINVELLENIEQYEPLDKIFGFLFLAYSLLPGYRAKLASDAFGDGDMKFSEAHTLSGVILKTHLSFLPVIGHFFNKVKKDDSNVEIRKLDNQNRFDD